MQRRQFLKLGSGATVGLGLTTNGIASEFLDWLRPSTNCIEVSDRVLVVVRLAGANDGLNMVVPLSQYGQYETLRPTIKLNQTGTGALINLDTTQSTNNLVGLHPSMTGFKSLYDSGKLSLIHNVGYPSPNYSHFIGENIMFAGKDGTTDDQVQNGFIGRYLESIFPNLSGNPQPFMQDPLALHFGSSNASLGFTHDHGTAEYNITSLQGTLFGQLAPSALPTASEYNDTLNYIKFVESGMDGYFARVNSVFNAGFNSPATYPNTDLAKQLRTIARMLKGGSKTKIFQVTLFGFDTHASQVVSGANHTGTHATLLSNVSSSISSFMSDLNALGLEDRVMVVSFSEFGRKAKENASFGTDHGDIAPMFVVGKHVTPGIIGTPPNLSNVYGGTDGRFFPTERQHDYRQVYTTLLQDWLGATNAALTSAELSAFQTQKLNLVTTAQNAYPTCQVASGINCDSNPMTITRANLVHENGGWSYYASPSNNSNYLFAIEKFPSGVGANTNAFDVTVDITEMLCSSNTNRHYIKSQSTEATLAAATYFNLKVNSILKPNGFVNIRWFINGQYITELNAAGTAFQTSNGSTQLSPLMYLKKVNSKLTLPDNLRTDGLGIHYAATPMILANTGQYNNQEYSQFNSIVDIDGVGGGAFIRASSLPTNDAVYNVPVNVPTQRGSIRFNSLTKTFEGHNGSDWLPMH
ncbi:DUF1501 domain-containing protein [Flavobacterium sp.]|uniref:DUF1501 domain-containing protein n=1 Tax=Flavobacterium sp. TaxID=239 RepID=UPI000EE0FF42|nr:DUF1501 domain-containing protein [Flavobacterium sp.]HCQ13875.1 hypothetical protein [Flavobacterium sp.]